MSQLSTVSQWETTVSTHLPHLSRPQAHVLALWSYGMVFARVVWHYQCGSPAGRIVGILVLDAASATA